MLGVILQGLGIAAGRGKGPVAGVGICPPGLGERAPAKPRVLAQHVMP